MIWLANVNILRDLKKFKEILLLKIHALFQGYQQN